MTLESPALHELQFDLHARYRLLADILTCALPAGGGRAYRLLDVGAGPSRLTEQFLPPGHATVIRTDVDSFGDSELVVVPHGMSLPFEDSTFDAVVAMDVLEHMPAADRPAFLKECVRTTQRLTVIATPIGGPAVSEVELTYGRIYRQLFNQSEHFLEEHASYGLPVADELGGAAAELGVHLVTSDNVLLADWLALNVADLVLSTINDGYGAKRFLSRRFNESLPSAYRSGAHYRRFYLLTRDPDLAAALGQLLDPTQLPDPAEHAEDALLVLAQQFRGYVENYNAPFLDAVLADRETAIAGLNTAIEAKDVHIGKLSADFSREVGEMAAMIEAKDAHIDKLSADHDRRIGEMASTIEAKDAHIDKLSADYGRRIGEMATTIEAKDALIGELTSLAETNDQKIAALQQVARERDEATEQLELLRQSLSWKLTAPLRALRSSAGQPKAK